MSDPVSLFSGMVAMSYFIAGLFFLKFWRRANDLLFASFAVAFLLFAATQGLVGFYGRAAETTAFFYFLRLLGFLLIILAIVRKNIRASQ